MRAQALTLILLAVISNNVSAALIRYKEHPVRHSHYGRSFNESNIAAASSEPVDSVSTPSTSLSQTPTQSSQSTSVLPMVNSNQVGSVPAEGTGDDAAKIDPQSLTQLSSVTTTDTPAKLAPTSTASRQVGSVPVEGSGDDATKINQQSLTPAQARPTGTPASDSGSEYSPTSPASQSSQGSSSAALAEDMTTTLGGSESPSRCHIIIEQARDDANDKIQLRPKCRDAHVPATNLPSLVKFHLQSALDSI
ncbi:MAG: hypothetical protein Q9168_000965 [Polycauliona sp. 1 TL-2023]